MSQRILRAVNQVRLTNVAIVRYKTHGKRFEIACYRNKVVNWRAGVETDLSEVLQAEAVFLNVSKGTLASTNQLLDCFGTSDRHEVCLLILQKGELQVSDGERDHILDASFKDVATLVSDMCINPHTKRPYPVSTIEQAMREIHFSLKPNKAVKKQALDVIPQLKEIIPLERAQMRIRLSGIGQEFRTEALIELGSNGVISKDDSREEEINLEVLVDPGKFRALDEFIKKRKGCTMEMLDFSVHEMGEADVEEIGDMLAHTSIKTINNIAVGGGSNKEGTMSNTNTSEGGDEEDDDIVDEVGPTSTNNKGKKKKKKKKGRRGTNRANEHEEGEEEEEEEGNDKIETGKVKKQINEDKNKLKTTTILDSNIIDNNSNNVNNNNNNNIGGLSCSSCDISFGDDRITQRNHYKSEWHRYNLKLKMISLPTVSLKEFEGMSDTDRDAILNDWKCE